MEACKARSASYPILLKASAGGGGKGMRRVDRAEELEPAFDRVSSEARTYFGDAAVYAEKLIERPRHIEVQVVGDSRGRRVAVGERECSLQRRHQKVVEECPSPVVTRELREKLCAAALAAARAVSYTSCGTVEFLLAPDGSFFFLEMNTRLQVEHPVTEAVTGLDLVRWQMRIARGDRFDVDPARLLTPYGHAIECRIYAEDPARGFAPSPGILAALRLPEGPGVRNDIGVEQGSVVPIDYDPMLGKLIVRGADRPEAIGRLRRALCDYEITGVETTLPLFRALVADEEFLRGAFDVQWLDRRLEQGLLAPRSAAADEVFLGAVGLARAASAAAAPEAPPASGWQQAARRELQR